MWNFIHLIEDWMKNVNAFLLVEFFPALRFLPTSLRKKILKEDIVGELRKKYLHFLQVSTKNILQYFKIIYSFYAIIRRVT